MHPPCMQSTITRSEGKYIWSYKKLRGEPAKFGLPFGYRRSRTLIVCALRELAKGGLTCRLERTQAEYIHLHVVYTCGLEANKKVARVTRNTFEMLFPMNLSTRNFIKKIEVQPPAKNLNASINSMEGTPFLGGNSVSWCLTRAVREVVKAIYLRSEKSIIWLENYATARRSVIILTRHVAC